MKSTFTFASTLALVAASAAAASSADAAAGTPYLADESAFELKIEPITKNDFGRKLASTCTEVVGTKVTLPSGGVSSTTFDADANAVQAAALALEQTKAALAKAEKDTQTEGKSVKEKEAKQAERQKALDKLDDERRKMVAAGASAAELGIHDAARAKAKQQVDDLGNAIALVTAVAAKAKALDDAIDRLGAHLSNMKATCTKLRDAKSWASLSTTDLDLLRSLHGSTSFGSLAKTLESKLAAAGSWEAVRDALKSMASDGGRGKLASGLLGGTAMVGLDSKLVNGLADFLVTRSKQEALLFLQENMTKSLCKAGASVGDKPFAAVPGLLLANTCTTLKGLDASISLHAMGTHLNSAAKKDLVALPDSLLHVATKLDPANHYIYEPGRLVYAMARKVEGGQHNPLDVLSSLHSLRKRKCETTSGVTPEDKMCEAVFQSVRWGSSALRAVRQQEDLEPVVAEGHAEAGPRLIAIALDFEALVAPKKLGAANVGAAMTAFRAGVDLALEMDRIVESLSTPDKDETPDERRRRLAEAFLDASIAMIETSRTFTTLLSAAPDQELSKALDLLQRSAELGQAILDRDYGSISVSASELTSILLKTLDNAITQTTTAILDKQLKVDGEQNAEKRAPLQKELDAMNATLADLKAARLLIAKVAQYTPFIVEIASAKSSKDVATAFEAAAAPVGSYKVKFDRPMITLNAFVGVSVANEWLLADRVKGSSFTFGGFAPVGVHMSKPLREDGGMPIGLMVSLLDLGTLTQQRFEQEVEGETKTDPATGTTTTETGTASQSAKIGWEQFFAPGLYLTMGLGTRQSPSPFTIGAGASVVPNLRSVELTDAAKTSFDSPVLRFGAFVAVDLTLLPLN